MGVTEKGGGKSGGVEGTVQIGNWIALEDDAHNVGDCLADDHAEHE